LLGLCCRALVLSALGHRAAAPAIALTFGYAFSWIAAFIGVTVRHAESVHDTGWVIPLTFASSTLVSIDAMPTGVQWFADINPVTSVADATRDLMAGDPAADAVIRATAWIAALLLGFVPLAMRAYQRR
jgi:ABC-type polysaccharide/polyol phosphate export permease